MQHVVTSPTEPFLAMNGALEVHQIPAWQDNLVWLVACTETRKAAVIDGPPEARAVLERCEQRGFELTAVINTHTHGDHIGMNLDLKRKGLLDGLRVIGAEKTAAQIPGITEVVNDGSPVRIGDASGVAWLTEGHLDGHMSYVFGDVVFSGDALFTGGCGRIFDGPASTMFDSLMRLAELPDGTRVCCGHEYTCDNLRFAWTIEPDNEDLARRISRVYDQCERGLSAVPSRIEEERLTNPFLRVGSPTILHILSHAVPDADLDDRAEVFAALRRLKDTGRYRKLPDEKLPI